MHFYATNPPIHQVCVIIAIVVIVLSCHGCCHHGFVVLITLLLSPPDSESLVHVQSILIRLSLVMGMQ